MSFLDDTTPESPSKTPTLVLDQALTHLATAVAALQRAGPAYAAHTQPFWHFAAGTWSPFQYRCKVIEASRKLAKKVSVGQDVVMAVEELRRAVVLLGEEGDWRDGRDLEEAVVVALGSIGNDL